MDKGREHLFFFSKEAIQMTRKGNQYQLIMKEMQIRTTMRYYFTPTRMVKIKTNQKQKHKKNRKVVMLGSQQKNYNFHTLVVGM